jgi:N-acetylglucosaminyldiphosphoundecaprenol N-acetyl-beta-D-mannosaminyltransferase
VIDQGKRNVLGVLVDSVDYEAAVGRIIRAAKGGRPLAVTALAVHGVMTGVMDPEQRYRLNHLDLVTADGQPVRWALKWLHGVRLPDRVYGPKLTLQLCAAAADLRLPVYLYGSRQDVVEGMAFNLQQRFPELLVAGAEPSKFRRLASEERDELVDRITRSAARILLVGLGCPRQEVFAYEYRDALSMPVVAVGAAFDYHAGVLKEPPHWIQDHGLHWLYRLFQEPRRLWKRYFPQNVTYLILLAAQATGLWRPDLALRREPRSDIGFG